MTVRLAPAPRQQYVNSSGVPYSGAKLFFYAAGTTTKQNTYTTSAGNVANTNPIVLDSSGRTPYGVWLTEGLDYKVVLAPANDTDPPASPIFTEDFISGINDAADMDSQWAASGVTPTYVSATQFTVPGDKTSTFLVDRRIRVEVTAGTLYGYISASAYTTLTTVTVVMDSGSLDSGLTAVDVGILTDLNSAIPNTITRNATAQTLTNKSLSDSTTYIVDNLDATKKAQFQVSGITTGTTRTITIPDKDFTPATIAANTFTGAQTLSGASVIDANATVAAHATSAAVWLLGNYVTLTGSATVFTDVADAPQAGAEVELYCNAAHTFTNNANFIVDGAADFTAAVGDRVLLRAKSTSVFTVHPRKANGRAVVANNNLDRRAITTTDTVGTTDIGNLIDCTSGTFTLAFAAAASLGDQASGYIQNSGTGDVTLDGNGAETVDGLATYIMYPGEIRRWYVEGSAIKTMVIQPFSKAFTASGTFTKPPGYSYFGGMAWSGGCSGQRTNNTGTLSVGGAGGGCGPFTLAASAVGTTETVTIGAGGAAVTGVANGNVGGSTSIGSLFSVAAPSGFTIGGALTSTLVGASTAGFSIGFESNGASTTGRSAIWGGSNPSNDASTNSGNSVYGGAAGGGVNAAGTLRNPGTSQQGGNGGAASIAGNGTDGTAPGGGGGATQTGTQSGAGARGELRIWGIA